MSRQTDLLLMLKEDALQQENSARSRRFWLDIVVAIVFGLLSTWMLVHYLTPCAAGTLCMGVVITPTRVGLWAKVRGMYRAWYFQRLIDAAEKDLFYLEEKQRALPGHIELTRLHLSALRVELIDAELLTRTS